MFKKLALLALVLAVTAGCTRIGPGYVGIKVNLAGSQRGVEDFPSTTGWVFYNPFGTSVYEYPTFIQTAVWTHNLNEGNAINEEVTFTNADQMLIAADINVAYSLVPDKIPAFYVKFRSDNIESFTHGYLRNEARDVMNEVAGKYKIDQIMGDNAEFLREVRTTLQTRLSPFGVELGQFGIIGAPRPPKEVVQAITNKINAVQIATQKQNELVQVQADAAKRVADATGQAEATLISAAADAEYNRRINASLTPTLVEWQKAQKWDGKLPQVTSGNVLMNLREQ